MAAILASVMASEAIHAAAVYDGGLLRLRLAMTGNYGGAVTGARFVWH